MPLQHRNHVNCLCEMCFVLKPGLDHKFEESQARRDDVQIVRKRKGKGKGKDKSKGGKEIGKSKNTTTDAKRLRIFGPKATESVDPDHDKFLEYHFEYDDAEDTFEEQDECDEEVQTHMRTEDDDV